MLELQTSLICVDSKHHTTCYRNIEDEVQIWDT